MLKKPRRIATKEENIKFFFDCAKHGEDEEILKYFDKVDLHTLDDDGFTAMHYAVYNGHLDVVRVLCKQGFNVDTRDRNGNTALHCIMIVNSWKVSEVHRKFIVKALLSAGANVLAVNNKNELPMNGALIEIWLNECEDERIKAEYVTVDRAEVLSDPEIKTIIETPKPLSFFNWVYKQVESVFPDVSHLTSIQPASLQQTTLQQTPKLPVYSSKP